MSLSPARTPNLTDVVAASTMKIPVILQKVSAGFPSPATDYVQDEIDLNSELIKNPPATFLIRVQGNSMTEHKIASGDLLVVDRSLNLKNDCIAIINFNNELVVKNIIKEYTLSLHDALPIIGRASCRERVYKNCIY